MIIIFKGIFHTTFVYQDNSVPFIYCSVFVALSADQTEETAVNPSCTLCMQTEVNASECDCTVEMQVDMKVRCEFK